MFGFNLKAVIVTVILVTVIVIYVAVQAQVPPPAETGKPDTPHPATHLSLEHQKHLIKIEREAVELAYKHQVERLFEGWMKDPTGQPDRAWHGMERARDAYMRALISLEKWEASLP